MATSKGDIMLEQCSTPDFPFYWWDMIFMPIVERVVDIPCDGFVILSGLGLGVAAAVVAFIPLLLTCRKLW